MKLYMWLRAATVPWLLLAVDAATVHRRNYVVKESIHAPPNWVRRGAADDNVAIALRFALKQSDVASLEERLRQTSDPEHPLYGQHLGADQVSQYLQPDKRSVEEVEAWLRNAGIHIDEDLAYRSPSKDTFTVHVPVWQARSLLKADLGVYEHQGSGTLAVRAEEYSIPQHVDEHIDYVGPLTLFVEPQPQLSQSTTTKLHKRDQGRNKTQNDSQPAVPASCDPDRVTSQCVREFYRTSGYTPQAPNKFFAGISGFDEDYANFDDFNDFLREQRRDAYKAGYNFSVELVNGGINDQALPGGEANMDVQTFGGIAFPIPFTFYSVGGRDEGLSTVEEEAPEPYEALLNHLMGLPDQDLPKVLSTSFGIDEHLVPRAYAKRVCHYIMALGSRGVSTIFAAGDRGVGGGTGKCVSNGNGAPNGTRMFVPVFPASCPWATTVGATKGFAPERVGVFGDQDDIHGSSAGGFSNYFAIPWYQKKVVTKYVESLGDQYQGLYNRSGRGFPDVSMVGTNVLFRWNGTSGTANGASLSAPEFAGVVALLNDVMFSQGKPSLGFLNPLIYGTWLGTSALNDITEGSNVGCDTDGFPAGPGWDAASGAGSPNFEAMKCSLEANKSKHGKS